MLKFPAVVNADRFVARIADPGYKNRMIKTASDFTGCE
jgi:hypothetical protein